MKRSEKPQFGVLDGVKVCIQGQSAAGPFAGRIMGQHGADIVWIESIKGQDVARNNTGAAAEHERLNMRAISLDIASPEGKEIFKKILADVDILVENGKAGQYKKWDLDDEVLWKINPKLVIVHVCGFGQYGEPFYTGKAAYDMAAQAFGGLVFANTLPGETYQRVLPGNTADYLAGLHATFAACAGYINVLKTGKGESFDIAQYEAIINCAWSPIIGALSGEEYKHNAYGYAVGYGGQKCKDGYLYLILGGAGVLKGLMDTIGMADEYGSENFPVGFNHKYFSEPGGPYLQERIDQYLATKTVAEAEEELSNHGVSCSAILRYDQMWDHPQYKARESLIKIKSRKGQEFVISNVVPKVKNKPGKIFRHCPSIGEDTSDILSDLGYTEAQIQHFLDTNVVRQTKDY